MTDWKLVRFNPTTHEVTSRNRRTGDVIALVVPPEYRTVEKSAAYIDSQYKKHVSPRVIAINKYKYLFVGCALALCFDLALRAYGV